jgi:predicted extracellular nuclease
VNVGDRLDNVVGVVSDTYVFEGNARTLDHILVTRALARRVE